MITYNSQNLTFVPEDLNNIISLEELTKIIADIIKKIRQDKSGEMYKLKSKIDFLNTYGKNLENCSASVLYQIYKNIISVSMELRALLKTFLPQLDLYNGIDYAIYYDNKRYFVSSIDIEKNTNVLSIHSNGNLYLNLTKTVEGLTETYKEKAANEVQRMISDHYQRYYNLIEGTYKGVLGSQKDRLKRGHVAEAYEAHLQNHHGIAFQYAKILQQAENEDIVNIVRNDIGDVPVKVFWAPSHESVLSAWHHIRGALGTQRGTVAGDVGSIQVKSGYSDKTGRFESEVQLTSLANLRAGIERYSAILDFSKTPEDIARGIAIYMSENINKKGKEIVGKKVTEVLNNISKPYRHI